MSATVAAHAQLPWANPLDAEAWPRLLDALVSQWAGPGRGLDIGCGPGWLTHELAQRAPQLQLLGVDREPAFIERAQAQGALPHLRFVCADAAGVARASGPFDVLLCIGASQAFGTPREALARCHALLNPGGLLLWADLEWAAEPPADFLAFLGCPADLYWHAEAPQLPGFTPLAREAASSAAWQAYEDAVRAGRLAHAAATGDAELRLKAQAWHAAFEDQGRHCFAFVAHLLRRTP